MFLASKYLEKHINGSYSLPLAQIMSMDVAEDLPSALQGKTLFLVCDAGLSSAQAVRYLGGLGISAFSVRGGIQDWGRAGQFKAALQ
jgi:rhodanese-related sulfurtransferase